MRAKRLTIKERKEVFQSLVVLQDQGGISNAESIQQTAQKFKIDDSQVEQIVDEGIEKDWLDEAVTTSA
jgi:hypothetical protein